MENTRATWSDETIAVIEGIKTCLGNGMKRACDSQDLVPTQSRSQQVTDWQTAGQWAASMLRKPLPDKKMWFPFPV